MVKISNLFKNVTGPLENFIKNQPIIFTLIILYQGLFSGNAVKIPDNLKKLFDSKVYRFFSLMLIAFAATQDIEYALLSTIIFLSILYGLKNTDERKKDGLI